MRSAVAGALAGGALLACYALSGCASPECAGAGDCATGEQCVDGTCLPSSACDGVTCAAGSTCIDGACFLQDCADRLCGGGTVCVDGACVAPGCATLTCPAGEACAAGRFLPTECAGVACGAGVCVDGRCAQRSCIDVSCPPGQACAAGTCFPADCARPCADGQVCAGGTCAEAACVGVVCSAGQTCSLGACAEAGGTCPPVPDCALEACNRATCDSLGRICLGGACMCHGGDTETCCRGGGDEDCDGLADCDDPDCAASPACAPRACAPLDLGSGVGSVLWSGPLTGAGDDSAPPQACTEGPSCAPEAELLWSAPHAGTFVFHALGERAGETVLHVRDGTCDGPALGCSDAAAGALGSPLVSLRMDAGQRVVVVLESSSEDVRALGISPLEAPDCADGADQDGNGVADCEDPSCAATDPCAGGEACANGLDDDADGLVDCDDPTCAGDAACTAPGCAPHVLPATAPVELRVFADEPTEVAPPCAPERTGAAAVAFQWTAPEAGRWQFEARGEGRDPVLYARRGTCAGAVVACSDDWLGGSPDAAFELDLAALETLVLVAQGESPDGWKVELSIRRR